MAVIQYSGNVDNPESFTQHDMEHLIRAHNETIDAIIFVLNYTEHSNKAEFEKSLEIREIKEFKYWTKFPQNKLISALGMANDAYKQDGTGPYGAFSPFLSIKIRNEISEYEETYSELSRRVGVLQWAFQKDMVFAFDKLCAEIRNFKRKYKHVVGLHNMLTDVDRFQKSTAAIIGSPEIEYFNGSITLQQAIAVCDKLSKAHTPLYPIHMYRDILRFQAIQDSVKSNQHERSRSSHYASARQDVAALSDRNIELAQTNAELEKTVKKLQNENAKLNTENSQLSLEKQQMAAEIEILRRGLFGKLKQKLAQRKK